jgi:hypothetical protein
MFLPATSAAGSMLYKFSLYGGLGLFSLFVLYDTTKIVEHAYTKGDAFDPYTESVGIYLDAINIFVRCASVCVGSCRVRAWSPPPLVALATEPPRSTRLPSSGSPVRALCTWRPTVLCVHGV